MATTAFGREVTDPFFALNPRVMAQERLSALREEQKAGREVALGAAFDPNISDQEFFELTRNLKDKDALALTQLRAGQQRQAGITSGAELTADALLAGAGTSAAGLREGALQEEAGAREGLALLEGRLSPFADAFGEAELRNLTGLATDPTQQAEFLRTNPFLDALRSEARESTFRTQSRAGDLGGTGTDEILQNKFLVQGQDLLNRAISRQLPILSSARGAATLLGTAGSDILSGIGRTRAGATRGAAQILGGAEAGAGGIRGAALTGSTEATASALENALQAIVTGNIADQQRRDEKRARREELVGGLIGGGISLATGGGFL